MKTSIKLLLIFIGVLGVLMLASDVVLWAYYKKGINGDGRSLSEPRSDIPVAQTLQPFKALVITHTVAPASAEDKTELVIEKENQYHLIWYSAVQKNLHTEQHGDTLYVSCTGMGILRLQIPAVEYIKMDSSILNLKITSLSQPALDIVAEDRCRVMLNDVKLQSFTYSGGQSNTVDFSGDGVIDSMKIQLGWYGYVTGNNVPVKSLLLKADSLNGLNLDKLSLAGLKRI